MKQRIATIALILLSAQWAFAQERWVATWATSPQQPGVNFGGPPAGAQAQPRPAAAPAAPPPITSFHDQTVRMVVRTSIGGRRVRLQLANLFGTTPLTLGGVHVALREKDSSIVAGSDRALTFNGKPSGTLFPGAALLSDPVDLNVAPMSDLAISLYVPGDSGTLTIHNLALHTTYIAPGDSTAAAALRETATSTSYYWISRLEVLAPADAGAIVTFGDSITDGTTSTVNADHSWPAYLTQRLAANPATAHLAVLNQGIAGNRLLREAVGPSALARFDRDVLSQPGVKWMTILEGINDIRRGTAKTALPADAVTAEDLIGAQKQLIERAHSHGIKVIGCTLTPDEGANLYSEAGEVLRQAVNQWIRTGGAFDAVVDFDAVVKDPNNPKQIRPDFNIRDHLHPNDAGYKAMAEAIDLGLFAPRTASAGAGGR